MSLLALAIFWYIISVSAAPPTESSRSFTLSVEQVPHIRSNIYRRGSLNDPTQLLLGGYNTVSLDADPDDTDVQYICELEIGGQMVRLDFDTGSSDLWIFSSFQPRHQHNHHFIYNPLESPTAQPLSGPTWTATYGDGSSVSGLLYNETISLDSPTGEIIISNHTIGLAANVSRSIIERTAMDGILGLGFPVGSKFKKQNPGADIQPNFFLSLRPHLPEPLFSAALKHRAPGSYDFGHIIPIKYVGEIKYFPVNSRSGFWGVLASGYAIGHMKSIITRPFAAIVDTGNTLNLLPDEMLHTYFGTVADARKDEKEGWIFPCDAELPDFFIRFGDGKGRYTARIPGAYVEFGPSYSGEDGMCISAMQPMDSSYHSEFEAILGNVFLNAVFVVFEYAADKDPRIGFATGVDID